MACAPGQEELVVDQFVSVLHAENRKSWGPRTSETFTSGGLTLALAAQAGVECTLTELPLLLSDEAYRRRLLKHVREPLVLDGFWADYNALTPAEQAARIGSPLNKIRAFLLRSPLRNMLGVARPRWSIEQVIAERKILIVPLSAGKIGQSAAALLGNLLLAKVYMLSLIHI